MSVEVLPVGVACQLSCTYCYETDIRQSKPTIRYHEEAVLAAIDKLPDHWSLFGGEALILPIDKIETLLKKGFDRWKYTGIQTNGVLITEAHIELFKKYKTHVGISLDGPDELNDSRWAGTLEATRKATAKTHHAIKRLCEEKMHPSIIVTLHAGNCSKERFPKFVQWIKDLDAMGVQYVNPHVMEMDHQADKLYLDQDELSDRMIDLWELQSDLVNVKISKFQEVLNLLQGNDNVACTWHACDPLNTSAVQSIDNEGAPSVCARTFKDGKTWLPAEGSGYNASFGGLNGSRFHHRQLALYVTPQEVGGCQGCTYWMMCKGQCPGEGINSDTRQRSTYCQTWKRLFAEGERRLKVMGIKPVSQMKDRQHMEELMYASWVQGSNRGLGDIVKEYRDCTARGMVPVKNGYHGDSN